MSIATMDDKAGRRNGNKREKKILHREFAQRMEQACDGNPHVPEPNYGRLGWVVEQLENRFNYSVTVESVRKWFAGESRPKPKAIEQLAEVFNVDDAWLATGRTPDMSPKQRQVRNAMVEGVVNVLAGVIQISGGHPAFPDEDVEDADLYAIIKGAQYSFRVLLAKKASANLQFFVPPNSDRTIVVGVVMNDNHQFDFYEIDQDAIEAGTSRGGYTEVVVKPASLRRIESFSERI